MNRSGVIALIIMIYGVQPVRIPQRIRRGMGKQTGMPKHGNPGKAAITIPSRSRFIRVKASQVYESDCEICTNPATGGMAIAYIPQEMAGRGQRSAHA